MPPRSRVKKPAVGRPYVERAPGDNYHSDAHCIDLDMTTLSRRSRKRQRLALAREYVRTPHELPGFQVGTKLQAAQPQAVRLARTARAKAGHHGDRVPFWGRATVPGVGT